MLLIFSSPSCSVEYMVARTSLDRGQTNPRRTTTSLSQRTIREHLERMNRKEQRSQEPRAGQVVDSTAHQTGVGYSITTSSSARMHQLDSVIVHVMTQKESLRNRQEHVATRVRLFVMNKLFRKVKFVNNNMMIQKAMKLVMDHEDVVAETKRVNFHMLYESVFNEALNTKRSACEQAGGEIVIETMAMMNPEEEFFTVEELCKLGRSTTERENKAFYWFFCSFLECVCGKKAWGRAKFTYLVSLACETNSTAKIVTASEETFALLLFDNYTYISGSKWQKRHRDLKKKRTIRTKRKQQQQTGGKESTQVQQQKVDTANLGDGTERDWHISMNCMLLWSGKIEPVPKQSRWSVSCWSSARIGRLGSSEEVLYRMRLSMTVT